MSKKNTDSNNFFKNCLYIPLAPANTSDEKGPNRKPKWNGPTVTTWSSSTGEGLYTWEERLDADWDRWGIVEWDGPERLLIIDIDLYKMDDETKVEVKGADSKETRKHKSQSGGLHLFYLVEKAKLKPEYKKGGELVHKLPDTAKLGTHIDDKLNGYVVGPSVEGYEIVNDITPAEIDPSSELPKEWLKEERQYNGSSGTPEELEDDELKERFELAKEKDKEFKLLWEGEYRKAGYVDDRSKAEYELANKIGFWFGRDESTIRGLMDKAATKKWPKRKDESYRRSVIEDALEGDTYTPGGRKEKKGPDSDEKPEEGDSSEDDPIEKYFTDDNTPKFIPPKLAKDIMEDFHFATIEGTSHIYVYLDGIYEKKGESFIEKIAQKRLGEYSRRHHKKEVIDYIKTHSYTKAEDFDPAPRKIVVENGILDLETRNLEDHTPEEIHTSKLPVKYDPKADCPDIKDFIGEVVGGKDDKKKIQELLGYTLLKENPLNKAFMGLGNGANGRSTLFRLFEEFLGCDNTSSVSLTELVDNRFASSDLFGKIANFSGETSDKKITDSYRFKELVGEDEMRGEEKYEKAFEFVNYATPWFASNELPETADKTRSFYRRWVIIKFPYTFTSDPGELELDDHKRKDPSYPESLITEEELSGLLNWALDGLDRVLKNDRFFNERTVSRKSELWELESNPVANFIEEWCVEDENAIFPKRPFWQIYNQFAKEQGHGHLELGQFTKKLGKKGISKSKRGPRGGRIKCYSGVRLTKEGLEEFVSGVSGGNFTTLSATRDLDCIEEEYKEYIDKVLPEDPDTPDTGEEKEQSKIEDHEKDEEEGEEVIDIRATEDIPEFVGYDDENIDIGKGDVMTISKDLGETLIERKKAEKVDAENCGDEK